MTALRWRWHERDFGFRFRSGAGRKKGEYYQAAGSGEFYIVPASQRKLAKGRIEELAALVVVPTSPRVVPTPWRDYDRDWDWITTADEILYEPLAKLVAEWEAAALTRWREDEQT